MKEWNKNVKELLTKRPNNSAMKMNNKLNVKELLQNKLPNNNALSKNASKLYEWKKKKLRLKGLSRKNWLKKKLIDLKPND